MSQSKKRLVNENKRKYQESEEDTKEKANKTVHEKKFKGRKGIKGNGKPLGAISEVEDIEIFNDLSRQEVNIKNLINRLEEMHKEEFDNVLLKNFLQFLLKTIGLSMYTHFFEDEDLEAFDYEAFFDKIYKDSEVLDPSSKPIDTKSKEYKLFQKNFDLFWKELFASSSSIIYETDILKTYLLLVEKLSKSKLKNLRMSSLDISGILMAAMIEKFSKDAEDLGRLKASGGRKTSEFEELKSKCQAVESLMEIVVNSIVSERYKDVRSEIRAKFIDVTLPWCNIHPEKFLHPGYLEILDRLLNLDDLEIKSMVLDGLFKLLSIHGTKGKNGDHLKTYFHDKKDKLFHFCLDTNSKLAFKGLLLFAEIRSNIPDLYQLKQIKQVYYQIFSKHSDLSELSASIVVDYIFENIKILEEDYSIMDTFSFEINKEESQNQIIRLCRNLLEIDPQIGTDMKMKALVRNFSKRVPWLFDFHSVYCILEQEKVSFEGAPFVVDSKFKSLLIHLTGESIKLCKIFYEDPKSIPKAQREKCVKLYPKFSPILLKHTTALLNMLKMDHYALWLLLSHYQLLDLEYFTLEENHELLKFIAEVAESTFDYVYCQFLSERILQVLTYFRKGGTRATGLVDGVLKSIIKKVKQGFIDNYGTQATNLDKRHIALEANNSENFLVFFKKLEKLSSHMLIEDFSKSDVYLILFSVLEKVQLLDSNLETVKLGFGTLYFIHLWKYKNVLMKCDSMALFTDYCQIRERFLERLTAAIMDETAESMVISYLFSLLTRVLLFISSDSLSSAKVLHYNPSKVTVKLIHNYVEKEIALIRHNDNPELKAISELEEKLTLYFKLCASCFNSISGDDTTYVVASLFELKNERFASILEEFFRELRNLEIKKENVNNTRLFFLKIYQKTLIHLRESPENEAKCREFAKFGFRIFFSGNEKREVELFTLLRERFTIFLADCIERFLKDPKKFSLLYFLSELLTKTTFEPGTYKKIMAYFYFKLKACEDDCVLEGRSLKEFPEYPHLEDFKKALERLSLAKEKKVQHNKPQGENEGLQQGRVGAEENPNRNIEEANLRGAEKGNGHEQQPAEYSSNDKENEREAENNLGNSIIPESKETPLKERTSKENEMEIQRENGGHNDKKGRAKSSNARRNGNKKKTEPNEIPDGESEKEEKEVKPSTKKNNSKRKKKK